jgi:hypothetical protein
VESCAGIVLREIFSSFPLKSCPNLAENVGTKGTNSGAKALSKQQNPNEPHNGIADQAMSRKINPHRPLDMLPLLVPARPS